MLVKKFFRNILLTMLAILPVQVLAHVPKADLVIVQSSGSESEGTTEANSYSSSPLPTCGVFVGSHDVIGQSVNAILGKILCPGVSVEGGQQANPNRTSATRN